MKESALRVGILGAGYISDWHVKALRQVHSARIVAAADVQLSRATSFASRFGIPKAVGSLRELRDEGCDVVHVLLPPDSHFAAASELLDAGIHVFLEKPACTRAEDCRILAGKSAKASRSLGVSHNFLFASVYERLKADVDRGVLGPLSEVSIVWNKEVGQWRDGPFGIWMLRAPGNIMLEVGPHSVAHLLDLVGNPDRLSVVADREITLPNGQAFFRRWQVRAGTGPTSVDLAFSFGSGFAEHRIHARGLIGDATVDFEAGTYVLRRHSPLPIDFNNWLMARRESADLRRDSRKKLLRYVLSKFKLSNRGNDFGTSLAKGISTFYENLNKPSDRRLSIDFATRVVETCSKIAELVAAPPPRQVGPTAPAKRPEVLVLGGTGFIGKALVRQLIEAGQAVRLMARDPNHFPLELSGLPFEAMAGNLDKIEDIERALQGISTVYHLARAHVKTWDEYVQQEIGGTRKVAEACLKTGVKRLLYTGTIDSYYAGKQVTLDDDAPLDPKISRRNLYARAKAHSERLLEQLRRDRGLPVAILRPGIVIGRGGSPFHWGVGMWNTNSVCQIWGRGDNPLPLVLVDDVARALVSAQYADGVVGETFNLVGEPMLTAREYVAELEKAAEVKLDVRPTRVGKFYRDDLFKWMVKVLVRHPERRLPSYRDWQSRTQRVVFDCRKAKRVLGWAPCSDRATVIAEGIAIPAREWLA